MALPAGSVRGKWAEPAQLSTDPQFIEKVRYVVGLYLDPPEIVQVIDRSKAAQGHSAAEAVGVARSETAVRAGSR
jgi:hypothetical protein